MSEDHPKVTILSRARFCCFWPGG